MQIELVVMYDNDNFVVYKMGEKLRVVNKATEIVELETENLYDALVHAKLHDRWIAKFYEREEEGGDVVWKGELPDKEDIH